MSPLATVRSGGSVSRTMLPFTQTPATLPLAPPAATVKALSGGTAAAFRALSKLRVSVAPFTVASPSRNLGGVGCADERDSTGSFAKVSSSFPEPSRNAAEAGLA